MNKFLILFVLAVLAFTLCEFKSFQVMKRFEYKSFKEGPPNHEEYALMARYIVHKAEWVSMATISTFPNLEGFPFVNVLSAADGPRDGKSTGNIYLYMTELDFSGHDLKKDNRLTLMISMDQDLYCRDHQLDTEDPRCARVMISGKIAKLVNGTEEYDFAQKSLYQRHPIMKNWPADHLFFFAKVKIANVLVLDWFGGPHSVTIEDYFNANPSEYKVESRITKTHMPIDDGFDMNDFDSNGRVAIDYLLIEEDQITLDQMMKDTPKDKLYHDNTYLNDNEDNQIIISMV